MCNRYALPRPSMQENQESRTWCARRKISQAGRSAEARKRGGDVGSNPTCSFGKGSSSERLAPSQFLYRSGGMADAPV